MDSKSISRKGVGVQLPSLALSSFHGVAWDASAWPARMGALVWAHFAEELGNARLALELLRAAVRADPRRALRDERELERLAELEARTRRSGWCLGVAGAAAGIDLLRMRREREGLRWLLGILAERLGCRLEPDSRELPLLEVGAGDGWEVPCVAGWCLLQAHESERVCVRWNGTLGVLAFEHAGNAERLAGRAATLARNLTRVVRLEVEPRQLVLRWS